MSFRISHFCKKRSCLAGEKGFTLLELLVVIAIIGVLAAIIGVATSASRGKAEVAAGLQMSASMSKVYGINALGSWGMEQTTGSSLFDDSGNGRNATVSGSPSVVSGVIGNAVQFNGGTQYAAVTMASNFNMSGTWTIAVWLKPTSFSSSGTSIGMSFGLPYLGFSGGKPTGAWQSSSGQLNLADTKDYEANQWYFLVLSHTGNKTSFYVNGKEVSSNNNANGVTLGSTNVLFFGRHNSGSLGCACAVDEMRVYTDSLLTREEIERMYVAEAGRFGGVE